MNGEPKIILTVLLAEDNQNDVELLSATILRAFPSAKIKVVTRLVEALAALGQHDDFNILILDLTLPDTVGATIVTAVRAVTTKPIIVITGDARESVAMEVRAAGADDCLVKGHYTEDSLRRAIAGAMGHLEGHLVEPLRRELKRAEDDEIESVERRKRIAVCLAQTDANLNHLKACMGLKAAHATQ